MTHGGKRPRSGRPPRAGAAADYQAKVWLTEAERAELTAALRDGEALADLLREGGLQLARRRKPTKETTMTKLTADTITRAQIKALREEALDAGDDDMARTCDQALYGSPDMTEAETARRDGYRQQCADAINAARAMES